MKKKPKAPAVVPPMPVVLDGLAAAYDPFGSYTGVPADPDEKPVQDADDL